MQKAVEKLSYERTGNELIALLKEEQSIKEIQPEFNQALRNKVYSHGLFLDKSLNYHQLYIKKLKDEEQPLMAFKNHQQARKVVSNFVEDYQLCPQLAGVEKKRSGACFNYGIDACKGACIAKESAETYNARLKQLTDRWNFDHKNFLLIDRGRFHHEKSLVHVKDGEVRGFAYFDLNLQITDRSILERIITPIAYQGHARQLVKSYIRKNEKRIKMIEL